MPRFAAPGDKFTANVQLFNMTKQELTVRLSAKSKKAPAELAISGGGKENRTVTIKGGGSATLPFAFEAKGVGTAEITYRTEWSGGKKGAIENLSLIHIYNGRRPILN